MKTIILVAAVAAFEFSFLASIATPPRMEADAVTAVRPKAPAADSLANGPGQPVAVTPRG
jgi:hypothetical protein